MNTNNADQIVAGMTLRDYFAAKAMVGLLASPRTPDTAGADITSGLVARLSYAMADAMLKIREGRHDHHL